MTENLTLKYNVLLAQTKAAMETEEQIKADLIAQLEMSDKRLKSLESAAASIEMGIEALNAVPEILSPGRRAPRKLVPIERGQGSRIAFDVLRDADLPLSLADLARQALARYEVEEPTHIQIKALEKTLGKSLQNAVSRGFVTRHETTPQTYSSAHK